MAQPAAPSCQGEPEGPCSKKARPFPEHWITVVRVATPIFFNSARARLRGWFTPSTSRDQVPRSARMSAEGMGRLLRMKKRDMGVTTPMPKAQRRVPRVRGTRE